MKYIISIIVAVEVEAEDEAAIMKMGPTIDEKLQEAVANGDWEIIENGIEEVEDEVG